jgi:hypothetical protein
MFSFEENKITRFEVIDHTTTGNGRILVVYGVQVELLIQDNGRTLKLIVKDRPSEVGNTVRQEDEM